MIWLKKLEDNFLNVHIYDPWVSRTSFYNDYNLKVLDEIPNTKYNAVILAVAHNCFQNVEINKILTDSSSVIYDIKGCLDKEFVTKRL